MVDTSHNIVTTPVERSDVDKSLYSYLSNAKRAEKAVATTYARATVVNPAKGERAAVDSAVKEATSKRRPELGNLLLAAAGGAVAAVLVAFGLAFV